MNKDKVYIFGHKNPDADAICSAIAYEAFKHATGQKEFVAARCGNTNARIDAILDHFQCPVPQFIGDVTPRINDIMKREVQSVSKQSTCFEALEKIDQHDVRVLPVVDSAKRVEGLISFFQLGEFFIPSPKESRNLRRVYTNIESIIRSLNAISINTVQKDLVEELSVHVGAMDISSFGEHHKKLSTPIDGSIVVVGDRIDIQEKSIQLGVRLLIISGGLSVEESIIKMAKEKGVSLIISPHDSATTSWIVRTASQLEGLVENRIHCFQKDDRVSSIKKRIAGLDDPLYMVIEGEKKLIGVFSKSDILRPTQKRIVLVDHNEISQAVDGASEVEILEVIDHHKLGNLPSEQPVLFINRPVGSTCSIIADLFRAQKIPLEKTIAGILMSGIISDTLLLSSPTTTPLEKELLEWLEPIAQIKSDKLADIIFSTGSVVLNQSAKETIKSDCKIYEENDITYSVSQIEELGFDNVKDRIKELKKALNNYRDDQKHFFSMLLITDINSHDSLLLVACDAVLKEEVKFPIHSRYNANLLKGVVSRKKQLLPYIASMLKNLGIKG
ncbi:MAG: putative manganese-dependent inorganic diphosphatase [Opitutae bacterium]|nr:putative manganese-dependent inorganic diphosphatase [Opitutae bacterium]